MSQTATMLDNSESLGSPERVDELRRTLGAAVCRRLGIYALPEDFRLSVVVPVYNEVRTIDTVVQQVSNSGVPVEIVLVDDGSTDGTRARLAELSKLDHVRVILHAKNQGKGAALRTGFAHATGDVVLIQDADLEYDPADYMRLLQPIIEEQADVVFGSRFLGDSHRVLYFWHYLGNRVLTFLSNLTTNLNLTDMETCYKAFRRETLLAILPKLRENRFGIEPELTARVAQLSGVKIHEVAIRYNGRTYADGKKITWRDGFRALWCIARYGLFR
jgi:glycosyltransferase involved in cell wall biosynthesis